MTRRTAKIASMLAAWPLALATMARPAVAEPKLLVVAIGDCKDERLLAHRSALAVELTRSLGAQVLDDSTVQAKLGAPASRSPDELLAQVEVAQAQYFNALYQKAERTALEARSQIERLPAGDVRWKLWSRLELLLALIYKGVGRTEDSAEAFRHVLRLLPQYVLDQHLFAPSVRTRFDKLRAEIEHSPRHSLSVASSPPRADVFIDGLRVGSTPYSSKHSEGRYQLVVSHRGVQSFVRQVELRSDLRLDLDLDFETAIHPRHLPCLEAPDDDAARLARAVKLGAHLGAGEVVWAQYRTSGPMAHWLSATLVNVQSQERIREGRLRMRDGAVDGLDALAHFLITGQAEANVTAPWRAPLSEVVEPSAGAVRQRVPPVVVPVDTAHAPMVAAASAPAVESAGGVNIEHRHGWKAGAGLVFMAAGVVLAGGGALAAYQSGQSWAEFNGHYANGASPEVDQSRDVDEVRMRATAQRTASILLFSAAAVSLVGGVWLYVSDEGPTTTVSAVLLPGAGGATFAVSGRFP